MAVEQAARDFGLVVLTSDHDTSKQGNVLLDAAATTIEEGFDLAATDNPTSTLLQVTGVLCLRGLGRRHAVICTDRKQCRFQTAH